MSSIVNHLLDSLHWRYATKHFDVSKKILSDDLHVLCEVMRLSPSSFGLQPRKIVHVTDEAIRQQLVTHSWGQKQIVEASDLFVLASKKNLTQEDVEMYVYSIAEQRNVPIDSLEGYKTMIINHISNLSPEQCLTRNMKQVYIMAGFLMESAALMGIDSCPMEGFDAQAYNDLLGLDALGLHATLVITLGYRSQDDKYAQLPKVRYSLEEILIER